MLLTVGWTLSELENMSVENNQMKHRRGGRRKKRCEVQKNKECETLKSNKKLLIYRYLQSRKEQVKE